MTTIILEENIELERTSFKNLVDLEQYIYEEILERKMQTSILEDKFIDF